MSEPVHGTAILVGADGVLIRGESGAGKSALAMALIERGARLIADDRLMLSACNGRLLASAPSAIVGRIELRGLGIVALPHERCGVIRLVADFVDDEELERMPEPEMLTTTLVGIQLPRQPIPSSTERAARLVEVALATLAHRAEGGLRLARV